MVSAIWNASSEGNLEAVKQLLQEHPGIDVEIKDHSGATPLIQAARNGHLEVVNELLNVGGANPFNGTVQGGPETYTTDEAILQLLTEARDAYVARGTAKDNDSPQTPSDQPNGFPTTFDPAQAYYRPMPPPGAEHTYAPGYYMTEGGYFIVPQQPMEYPPSTPFRGPQQQPSESTKNIPCRYFPNCRYGASCHFAHPALPPPAGYYTVPPPQSYPHYDPNAPIPYNPQFYPGHPVFPPLPPLISPPPPLPAPASPQLDATSPAPSAESNGQFPAPPTGFVMTQYASPMTPNGVPTAYITPFPAGAPGAYPSFPYPPPSPTRQRNGELSPIPIYPYPPFAVAAAVPTPASAAPPSSNPATETELRKNGREAVTDGTAGSATSRHVRETSYSRRPSRMSVSYSTSRKTQALCMFFPSGKCRNGDDCRFVHALPEDNQFPVRHIPLGLRKYRERGFSASGPQGDRRGEFEVRYPNYGGVHPDKASIAQALASLPSNMRALNLSNSRNDTTRNGLMGLGMTSASRNASSSGSKSQPQQQRVPSEEDFPSLNGSTRTPTTNGAMNAIASNGGKTAAQILKSSPPTSTSQKFRPKEPIAPRSGEMSSSSSEKTTDVESLKSGGTNNTDQLTRPTSPEDSASELPKPHASTIEVPPMHA